MEEFSADNIQLTFLLLISTVIQNDWLLKWMEVFTRKLK